MNQIYDFDNAVHGFKYQRTVEDFMELLRNGKLHKNQHAELVNRFVKWVEQDNFWDLAKPIVPELRTREIEES